MLLKHEQDITVTYKYNEQDKTADKIMLLLFEML